MQVIKKLVLVLALLLLFALPGWSAQATGARQVSDDVTQQQAVAAAADWLVRTHQNSDGGYSSFSVNAGLVLSDIGGTLDAMIALSSAGYPVDVPHPAAAVAPLAYLMRAPAALVAFAEESGANGGKLLLGLAAAGQNPRAFLGEDFVALVLDQLAADGNLGVTTAYDQAFALLGLAAAAEPAPPAALDWLIGLQAAEADLAGSWDDGFGTAGSADSTAMATMALLAHGQTAADPVVAAARAFMLASRLPAGWEYGPGFGANANSTALVVAALSALGEDFYSIESEWVVDGVTPLAALLAWQGPDGGFEADFGSDRSADFYATVQSLPAASGRTLPLPNPGLAAARAASCLVTLQDPASGGWPSFAGGEPDAGGTARAIQALLAVSDDARAVGWPAYAAGDALAALASLTPDYLSGARGGRAGAIVLAVVAAGGDPRDFAGLDLIALIEAGLNDAGEYDDTSFGPFAHSRAMQALAAAGVTPDPAAIAWLTGADSGGDWGDPDANGLALHVLSLVGEAVPGTVALLRAAQLSDGGWGFDAVASPSTTAEVAQGLIAAGHNPFSPTWQQASAGRLLHAADAVLATQAEDGCWPNQFGPGSDPFTTVDAILLLTSHPFNWDQQLPEPAAPELISEPVVEPTATSEPVPTAAPEPAPTATVEMEVTEAEVSSPTAVPPAPSAVPTESPAADPGTDAPATGWLVGLIALVAFAGGVFFWRRR